MLGRARGDNGDWRRAAEPGAAGAGAGAGRTGAGFSGARGRKGGTPLLQCTVVYARPPVPLNTHIGH